MDPGHSTHIQNLLRKKTDQGANVLSHASPFRVCCPFPLISGRASSSGCADFQFSGWPGFLALLFFNFWLACLVGWFPNFLGCPAVWSLLSRLTRQFGPLFFLFAGWPNWLVPFFCWLARLFGSMYSCCVPMIPSCPFFIPMLLLFLPATLSKS